MLYAKRDKKGNISALLTSPGSGANEKVSIDTPEVIEFLNRHSGHRDLKKILTESDIELARVVEDLIDLLVQKNIIMLTELPEAAQMKITGRRRIRDAIQGENILMVDEDDIL